MSVPGLNDLFSMTSQIILRLGKGLVSSGDEGAGGSGGGSGGGNGNDCGTGSGAGSAGETADDGLGFDGTREEGGRERKRRRVARALDGARRESTAEMSCDESTVLMDSFDGGGFRPGIRARMVSVEIPSRRGTRSSSRDGEGIAMSGAATTTTSLIPSGGGVGSAPTSPSKKASLRRKRPRTESTAQQNYTTAPIAAIATTESNAEPHSPGRDNVGDPFAVPDDDEHSGSEGEDHPPGSGTARSMIRKKSLLRDKSGKFVRKGNRAKRSANGNVDEEHPTPKKRRRSNDGEKARDRKRTVAGAELGALGTAEDKEKHADGNTDKRVLRSQEKGARNKTILDTYFPWLDDEWAAKAKEQEYIAWDTPITIVDDKPAPAAPKSTDTPRTLRIHLPARAKSPPPPPLIPKASFPTFDFSTYLPASQKYTEDPLPPAHFAKPHRRLNVAEKRLRNIERERVVHEISKLTSQLDILRNVENTEWVRALGYHSGMRGVSLEERREMERKRREVVRELEGIVRKWECWRESGDGKRRRGTDTHSPEADESAPPSDDDDDDEKGTPASSPSPSAPTSSNHSPPPPSPPPPTTPTPRRHHHHPTSTTIYTPGGGKTPSHLPLIARLNAPFTSFYASRPHLRPAALNPYRRAASRNLTAFGVALPDFARVRGALGGAGAGVGASGPAGAVAAEGDGAWSEFWLPVEVMVRGEEVREGRKRRKRSKRWG